MFLFVISITQLDVCLSAFVCFIFYIPCNILVTSQFFTCRYYALRPLYEDSKEKINELEKIIEELNKKLQQNHNEKVGVLEIANAELLQEKNILIGEINNLKSKVEAMEVDRFSYDELLMENNELKTKQKQLMAIVVTEEGDKYGLTSSSNVSGILHGTVQNGDMNVQRLVITNGSLEEGSEHNTSCSHKMENSEVNTQTTAGIEKLKFVEEQLHIENHVDKQVKLGLIRSKCIEMLVHFFY